MASVSNEGGGISGLLGVLTLLLRSGKTKAEFLLFDTTVGSFSSRISLEDDSRVSEYIGGGGTTEIESSSGTVARAVSVFDHRAGFWNSALFPVSFSVVCV